MNSKNIDDWEKNFQLFNEALGKVKSYKTIDPIKMTQGKFTINFELLQFVYDYVVKSCENGIRLNGFERRLEILKIQNGSIY